MTDLKLTELTTISAVASDDLLYIVDTSGSTSHKVALGMLLSTKYNPDVAPTTTSGSYGDEFDDDTITGWTYTATDGNFDLDQTTGTPHISESEYHGFLLIQGDMAKLTFTPSISQAFTIVVKMYPGVNLGVNESWGQFQIRGQSDSYLYQIRAGRYNATADSIRIIGDNGSGPFEVARDYGGGGTGPYYLMFVHDGSKGFSTFYSRDGMVWSCVDKGYNMSNWTSFTEVSLSTTDQKAGDGVDGMMAIEFIRYWDTAFVYKIGKDV